MDINPYQSRRGNTSNPVGCRAHCPRCASIISMRRISRTAFPIFITCDQCSARLIGDAMVKTQAVLVVVFPFVFGGCWLLAVWPPSPPMTILMVSATMLGWVAFALLNIPLTAQYGRYICRDGVSELVEGDNQSMHTEPPSPGY